MIIKWLVTRLLLGWSVVRVYSKLSFAIIILIIVPIVLLWIVSSIFDVASKNINSIEVDEVASLHNSIQFVANLDLGSKQNEFLADIVDENERMTSLRIFQRDEDGLYSETVSLPTSDTFLDQYQDLLDLAVGQNGETLIFPFQINNEREWQATRYIKTIDGEYIIATTHNFAQTDNLLASRTSNLIYFFLIVIFALALLVYWVYRQQDQEIEVWNLKNKLKENDLFSSNMVHELRAPLTAIKGYSSLINESVDRNTDVSNYSTQITDSATRMINLINDFLNANRIQSGKEKIEIAEFSLHELLSEIVVELQPISKSKSLYLKVDEKPDQSSIISSKQHLRQVFTNLITNSIKYTEKGGVTISIDKSGSNFVTTIKDTGVGMSADDQKKLFAPFVRVGDASTSHYSTGTGLGMWITKKLIEIFHGEVGVESIKGVGTHVVVKLPQKFNR